MGSKPITQRAGTKYGSAPANQEVTVDAGGKHPARFPRMSPLKNSALVKGAGDVGYSKNQPIEFDMDNLKMEKEDKGINVSPAKQSRTATWNKTEEGEETTTTVKGDTETNYSGGGTFKNEEEKDWYDGEIKKRVDSGMSQDEAVQDYRNTYKIGTKKTTTGPDKTITSKDPDETYTGNLYKAQSGTATSSYRGRSDRRNVKATTKDQFRNTVRGLRNKIGTKGEDGKVYTREQFKADKKKAKSTMFQNRQKAFDNQEANLQRQIEQGRIKGQSYRRPDRVKTFGDYESDEKQMEMGLAQQKAERARRQAATSEARKSFAKSYFQVGKDLLNSQTTGIDYKANTPSLTKPKSLMYDLSSFGSDSSSSTQPFSGLSQEDQYTLARSGVQKRGYKMGGFGAKNKNK